MDSVSGTLCTVRDVNQLFSFRLLLPISAKIYSFLLFTNGDACVLGYIPSPQIVLVNLNMWHSIATSQAAVPMYIVCSYGVTDNCIRPLPSCEINIRFTFIWFLYAAVLWKFYATMPCRYIGLVLDLTWLYTSHVYSILTSLDDLLMILNVDDCL